MKSALELYSPASPAITGASLTQNPQLGVWKSTSGCEWHEKDAWYGKYKFQAKVERVSKALLALPFDTVTGLIQVQGYITWKLCGDKAQNLLQCFASKYSSEVLFGPQLKRIEEDYRRKFPPEYMCDDGHRVRSLSEQAIDNWL